MYFYADVCVAYMKRARPAALHASSAAASARRPAVTFQHVREAVQEAQRVCLLKPKDACACAQAWEYVEEITEVLDRQIEQDLAASVW
jgi:hypothetical protein